MHWLVVVWHDRKHRVGAGGLGAPGQFDGLAGRIGSGAGNDADPAARDLDGGANDGFVLVRRQGRGFAGGFAGHDRRDARLDLAFAKACERGQIDRTAFVKRGGKIGDVARQPGGGICKGCHGISRCVFHLAEALPIGGKHKALPAPDTGLDPETHLLQPGPDFQAEAAFVRIDQDGNGRAGAEKW